MSTYVIGDIHGCFDEFTAMLDKIKFSSEDKLYLVGDYVDRGPKTLEMLRWLEKSPSNVFPVKGNHDVEFVTYVRLLRRVDASDNLLTDPDSNADTCALLESLKYVFKRGSGDAFAYFDYYGTIADLIVNKGVTFGELLKWKKMLESYPLFYRFNLNGRDCVVVHAGFGDEDSIAESKHPEMEQFCLYAREDALEYGGIRNGMIISGHTPTIVDDPHFAEQGKVFRFHDQEKDCIFYDIDCGSVFRTTHPSAKLACLRLEDEEVFYL